MFKNLVIHNLHNTLFISYIIIYYNSDQKKSTLVNHITDLMIIKNTVQYFQAFGMKTPNVMLLHTLMRSRERVNLASLLSCTCLNLSYRADNVNTHLWLCERPQASNSQWWPCFTLKHSEICYLLKEFKFMNLSNYLTIFKNEKKKKNQRWM